MRVASLDKASDFNRRGSLPSPRASERPRRSLKNLLQEARLPPWLRARLPLLYCGDTLVYVPGIGIDTAFGARSGEPAVEPQWQPNSSQNGA